MLHDFAPPVPCAFLPAVPGSNAALTDIAMRQPFCETKRRREWESKY